MPRFAYHSLALLRNEDGFAERRDEYEGGRESGLNSLPSSCMVAGVDLDFETSVRDLGCSVFRSFAAERLRRRQYNQEVRIRNQEFIVHMTDNEGRCCGWLLPNL